MDDECNFDTVIDDCDFLLQLAEECAHEDFEKKGYIDAPKAAPSSKPTPPMVHEPLRPKATTGGLQILQQRNMSVNNSASSFYVESLSGLKVTRPVIGSIIVRERLSDKTFVKVGDIKKAQGGLSSDWATVAVLVSKSQRTGKTGSTYSLWQINDLDDGSATLFVFGNAHMELYKEMEGSVIIIYGAKMQKDKDGKGWNLSVDKPEQVTRIGHSPDVAFCRGTKPDGTNCRAVVNRSKCEYCPYHASKALKSMQHQRPELRGRNMLERQLAPVAAKAEQQRKWAYGAGPAQTVLSGQQLKETAVNLQRTIQARFAVDSKAAATSATAGTKRSRGMTAVLAVAHAEEVDAGVADDGVGAARGSKSSSAVVNAAKRSRRSAAAAAAADEEEDVELEFESEDDNRDGSGKVLTAAQTRLLEVMKAKQVEKEQAAALARAQQATRPPPTEQPQTTHATDKTHRTSPKAAERQDSVCSDDDLFIEDDESGVLENQQQEGAGHIDGGPSTSTAAENGQTVTSTGNVHSSTANPSAPQSAPGGRSSGGPLQASGKSSNHSNNTTAIAAGKASVGTASMFLASGHRRGDNHAALANITSTAVNMTKQGPLASHASANATGTASTSKAKADPSKAKMLSSLGVMKKKAATATPVGSAHARSASGPLSAASNRTHTQQQRPGQGQGKLAAAHAATQARRKPAPTPAPVHTSALAAAFGNLTKTLKSDDNKDVNDAVASRYEELGEESQWNEFMEKLEHLEKKDALVQKLDETKSLKVSAWQCKDCNFISEFKRKECAGHQVVKVQATKRFWQCGHCNGRFNTVGVFHPNKRCPRCNDPGMLFKAVSMYSGSKGDKPAAEGAGLASRENFLTRGTEHSFSLKG